jgi:hypothetical protein
MISISIFKRLMIPMLVLGACGLLAMIDLWFPWISGLRSVEDSLVSWVTSIIAFSLFVGTTSFVTRKVRSIKKKDADWVCDAWALVIIVAVLVLYVFTGSTSSAGYQWWYNAVYTNAGSAMISLLGFYVVYSAYRSMIAKTLEVGLMITAAILVFLTNATIGEAIWGGFPLIGRWILDNPVLGVTRAITIAAGISGLAMGLRMLIGREKAVLG